MIHSILKPTVCRIRFTLSAMSLGLILGSPVHGSKPHVHGIARLQVAIEGDQLDLIFTSPAANLIGFEHAPENEAQHKTLEDAAGFLKDNALIGDGAGGCTLTDVSVASALLNGKDRDGGHQDGTGHDGHDDSNHDDDHGHESDEEPAHSDFTVTQQLRCSAELRGALRTPLLERFESIERLQVQWIDDSGQGSANLTRDNAAIRLRD